jgi:hypothetical protein
MAKRRIIVLLFAVFLTLTFPIAALADVIGGPDFDLEPIVESVFSFFSKYLLIEAIVLVCVLVVGTIVMIWLLMRRKNRR